MCGGRHRPIHICSVGPMGKEAAYKTKLYKIMKAWFLFSQSSETFHCYKYHVMTQADQLLARNRGI